MRSYTEREVLMAKEKRFWYECVLQCDIGWYGPDQRRERWPRRGRSEIQPDTMHSVRLTPEHGRNGRGEPFPADYIVTDKPVGRSYTEVVTKGVSRPETAYGNIGGARQRVMRVKESKIKLRLMDPDELTREIRYNAYDYGPPEYRDGKQVKGWVAALFEDNDKDVVLPKDMAKWAQQVAADVGVKKEVPVG